jgi:DNA modification methylase
MPLVGEIYRTDRATLVQGDCLDVLRCLEDGEADSLVTDPPSGTSFMNKSWDSFKSRDAFVDFLTCRLAECRRVCRPGAVGLVWALPRTSHWTALAIEEAGWYIEDVVCHLFGTGMPKHTSKLKPGHEQWVLCRNPGPLWLGVEECRINAGGEALVRPAIQRYGNTVLGHGLGVGTQQEPAGRWPANLALSHHPECVCQGTKKVKGTHRVCARGKGNKADPYPMVNHIYGKFGEHGPHDYTNDDGTETVENWTCHPDCPIRLLDEQAGNKGGGYGVRGASTKIYGGGEGFTQATGEVVGFGDSGGPSRFFANFPAEADASRFLYCSKASKKDRGEGNRHNTVKSTKLMSWLVKLACPEGGLVLDPFSGSGSTGVACLRTGRRFLGVESDRESCLTAARRLLDGCEQRSRDVD